MQTIDMTPTWASMVDMLVRIVHEGDKKEARGNALMELRRMAAIADAHVARVKADRIIAECFGG